MGLRAPRYYIEALTEPGDVVFDPATGGGPIPVICKELGRVCIATEIVPAVAALARKRLSDDSAVTV